MTWLLLMEPSILMIVGSGIALITVLLASTGAALLLDQQRRNLPFATRYSDLKDRVKLETDRLEKISERLAESQSTLEEREQVKAEAEYWRSMAQEAQADYEGKADLIAEMDKLRAAYAVEAEQLGTLRSDIADLDTQKAVLDRSLEAIQKEIDEHEGRQEEIEQLNAQREREQVRLNEILSQISDGESVRQDLVQIKAEAERQRVLLENATRDLAELEDKISTLEPQRNEIEELTTKAEEAHQLLIGYQHETETLSIRKDELEARIAVLEEKQGALAGGPDKDERFVLEDLYRPPSCLVLESPSGEKEPLLPRAAKRFSEPEALERVRNHLEALGLRFTRRTIDRFHTSLKTGAISPITILAGISGTGKSQLPQRYAEALGIHFLKIAVQPRWDSPQDLLGFYNYLEGRYKATDLARALVHIDPFNWPKLAEEFSKRMLLVLLDEMNLARVEYYFSEFLSRLEGRPAVGNEDQEIRVHSEIEIDIRRGGEQTSLRIYPGHNSIFVGTMNEDESTQSLSDKVLDRSNVLRFTRPKELSSEILGDSDQIAKTYLPQDQWHSWVRKITDVPGEIGETIEALNVALEGIERPFGHRVNQAILYYVSNYPGARSSDRAKMALADQMELRILPKLRGIEIDKESRRAFQEIETLVRREMEDEELADAIRRAAKGGPSGEMFHWTGVRRDDA